MDLILLHILTQCITLIHFAINNIILECVCTNVVLGNGECFGRFGSDFCV